MPRGVYPRNQLKDLNREIRSDIEAEKKTINRPHWKAVAEEMTEKVKGLEKELRILRKSNGGEPIDVVKIKAEAFAAGVAAASGYLS